ncbi:MAG: hypothetical protein E4H14_03310 [Candidatus Thorarchaeota archaeon]|nr:MAG: hypothetical protein E4H14_03310 [Candidatus Thorarchaeota archaeon]
MYGIFLINDAGETVASMGWENLEGDSALLGGFVSALQMFIKKISGNEINELQFGDLKLLIGKAGENYIVTLHAFDDTEATAQNQEVIKLVLEQGGNIDDGVLGLIKEMVTQDTTTEEEKEKVRTGIRGLTGEASSAAKEWGKKVF